MEQYTAVILAAGEGKRMKSKKSKVVHKICGKSLIEWVYQAVSDAGIQDVVVVIGHKADQVSECLGSRVEYALQDVQLGTGHAVKQAEKYFMNKDGHVIVLCGDTPLITPHTIKSAMEFHESGGYSATVITAKLEEPAGYGRIVRNGEGNICRIVEHKDALPGELDIKEINSGIYCFRKNELVQSLKQLCNNNSQGEYYLTDTIGLLIKEGCRVGAYEAGDYREVLGVNDRVQLWQVGEIIRQRILNMHMMSGVTIIDPGSTYIDECVRIGVDTVIYPSTIIEGQTAIGEDCIIGPGARIINCTIGNGTKINNSVMIDSSIGENTDIGPFAYIRPESSIGNKVKIGDFVEIKKSTIGDKTKIPHLAYIGDADIGRNTNIACGVITVNYDGKKKHKTIIGNNAFVGCNVNLVAPVEVKDNSYIAAGSTITEEVPEYSLAIARSRQVNKEDWVKRRGMERIEK